MKRYWKDGEWVYPAAMAATVVYGDERDELLSLIREKYPEATGLPECPPEDMIKGLFQDDRIMRAALGRAADKEVTYLKNIIRDLTTIRDGGKVYVGYREDTEVNNQDAILKIWAEDCGCGLADKCPDPPYNFKTEDQWEDRK